MRDPANFGGNSPLQTIDIKYWVEEPKKINWEEVKIKRRINVEKFMEEKSIRHNEGKLQWSLVDFKSLEPLVRVLEFGQKKYSRDNWKKGLDLNQTLESLSRHLFALMSGEELDGESGLPHIGHIMCNAMFHQYHTTKNGTK